MRMRAGAFFWCLWLGRALTVAADDLSVIHKNTTPEDAGLMQFGIGDASPNDQIYPRQAVKTTAKKTTAKTTPKAVVKTTPKTTPKKTTPKTTPKTTAKKTTAKTTPKTTAKTTPKTTAKTTPKTTPKTTAKTSPKTTAKTTARTTAKITTSTRTTTKATTRRPTSSSSRTTTRSTTKSTSRTTTTTTSRIRTSVTSASLIPTACNRPDDWAEELYINSTGAEVGYAWLGRHDSIGGISKLKEVRVWIPEDSNKTGSYDNLSNSVYLDITEANIIKARYQNGTEFIFDAVNGYMSGSDCDNQYVFPLPDAAPGPTKRELARIEREKRSLEKRTKFWDAGKIHITLDIKTQCGDPATGSAPLVDCINTTPQDAPYFLGSRTAYLEQTTPGRYEGGCPFPYRVDDRDTPGCTVVKPALQGMCEFSEKWLNRKDLANLCTPFVSIGSIPDPDAQAIGKFAEWCKAILEGIDRYCTIQDAIINNVDGYNWDDFWCHPPPDYTTMKLVGGFFDGSRSSSFTNTIYGTVSEWNLGDQRSDQPHDISIQHQIAGPSEINGCGVCQQTGNMGYRRLLSSKWETVYEGSLTFDHHALDADTRGKCWSRHSFQLDLGVSFADADTQCRAASESGQYVSYVVMESTNVNPDTGEKSVWYHCFMRGCVLYPSDFKIASQGLKIKSYTHDLIWVPC